MTSPSLKSLMLRTTATDTLSTLMNVAALGMQMDDIYGRRNLGDLLTDTSDAARAGGVACQTCGGAGRTYAPGSVSLQSGGRLESCPACGGAGYLAPPNEPA